MVAVTLSKDGGLVGSDSRSRSRAPVLPANVIRAFVGASGSSGLLRRSCRARLPPSDKRLEPRRPRRRELRVGVAPLAGKLPSQPRLVLARR